MEKVIIHDCTLYRGNCLEMLETVSPGSIDCAWSDPPYGIGYLGNHRKVMEKQEMLLGDDRPRVECVPLIVRAVKDGGAVYLCTRFDVAHPWVAALTEVGATMKTPIYWIKDNLSLGDLAGDRGAAVEIVLFAHKGRHLLRGKRVINAWNIPRADAVPHNEANRADAPVHFGEQRPRRPDSRPVSGERKHCRRLCVDRATLHRGGN